MKKIYFILSLLATTVASAYAAVNPPTIGFPTTIWAPSSKLRGKTPAPTPICSASTLWATT